MGLTAGPPARAGHPKVTGKGPLDELSSGFIARVARSAVRERQGSPLGLEQTREARLPVFSFPIEVR